MNKEDIEQIKKSLKKIINEADNIKNVDDFYHNYGSANLIIQEVNKINELINSNTKKEEV